jgi:hypothetical protein
MSHRHHGESDGSRRGRRDGKQVGILKEPPKAPTTSELFIARVIRLEDLRPPESGVEGLLMPLVYFRKGYTTLAVPTASGAVGAS